MNKTNKRVTIKDIAEYCGTTANTVSRAMRNDPGISEATIHKIQQVAQEMGYIRNNLAATMRSGQSKLISVIVDDIKNPHNATLIDKMDSLLKEEGYDTMTLCTQGRLDKRQSMANLSVSNSVDGILYFPDSNDADIANKIMKNRVPLVLIDRVITGVSADVVRCDDYQGGVLAAEHLLNLGHRKFVYIGGPKGNGAQPLRQSGFINTLIQRGINLSHITIIDADQIYPAIQAGTIYNILSPIIYTCIFSFNDQIAYHVMNSLRDNGYQVPDDISIIGFAHIRGALSYLQPLSSIASKYEADMAEKSVLLLLRRIKEPNVDTVSEILPVTLHEQISSIKNIMV